MTANLNLDNYQRREELARRIHSMAKTFENQGKNWHPGQEQQWNEINADYDRADVAYQRSLQNIGRDGASLAAGPVNRQYFGHDGGGDVLDRAVSGWVRNQLGQPISSADASACDQYGISAQSSVFAVRFQAFMPRNGLQSQIGSEGGNLVPQGFATAFEIAMTAASGMLQASEIWRSADGRETPWPTCNDTDNEGELIGEGVEVDTQDPSFGAVIFRSRKLSSKLVRVAHELLRDSSVNLAMELGKILGARIGRRINRLATNGLGSGGEPQGILPGSTLGVTATGATSIAFDELYDLLHSVDAAYRTQADGAGWMMADGTAAHLRKKKDGEGQYIWQQSTQLGQPDLLLGWPVTINSHMPAIAASAKPILFGAMRKFKIRLVAELRLRRLVERYAEFDQEGFLAFQEFDCAMLDAGTNPVKHLVMAP